MPFKPNLLRGWAGLGNTRSNQGYLGGLDVSEIPLVQPRPNSGREAKEHWLNDKYVARTFVVKREHPALERQLIEGAIAGDVSIAPGHSRGYEA